MASALRHAVLTSRHSVLEPVETYNNRVETHFEKRSK